MLGGVPFSLGSVGRVTNSHFPGAKASDLPLPGAWKNQGMGLKSGCCIHGHVEVASSALYEESGQEGGRSAEGLSKSLLQQEVTQTLS